MIKFTDEQLLTISEYLKIDINELNLEEIRKGMEIELEHGSISPLTNITNDDILLTFKIVLSHLFKHKNYYQELENMLNRL